MQSVWIMCFSLWSTRDSGLAPGEIAKQLLEGNDSSKLRDLIQRCDLCGFCTRDCPLL